MVIFTLLLCIIYNVNTFTWTVFDAILPSVHLKKKPWWKHNRVCSASSPSWKLEYVDYTRDTQRLVSQKHLRGSCWNSCKRRRLKKNLACDWINHQSKSLAVFLRVHQSFKSFVFHFFLNCNFHSKWLKFYTPKLDDVIEPPPTIGVPG